MHKKSPEKIRNIEFVDSSLDRSLPSFFHVEVRFENAITAKVLKRNFADLKSIDLEPLIVQNSTEFLFQESNIDFAYSCPKIKEQRIIL